MTTAAEQHGVAGTATTGRGHPRGRAARPDRARHSCSSTWRAASCGRRSRRSGCTWGGGCCSRRAATVVLVLMDRVSRRLLPLAALFKLSLVFPDRAPVALPHRCPRRLDRVARAATRQGTGRSQEHDARRGGRAPARPRRGARPARPAHERPLGARARLRAPDRGGAAPVEGRDRPPQLGGAPPRRRQARGAERDPDEAGPSDRRRVGRAPRPPGAGPRARGPARAVARRMARGGTPASRALGRAGVPRRPRRERKSLSRAALSPSRTCST